VKKKLANVGASVRAKILSLSKERKEENLHLLERFCLERLLYRLSKSAYKDRFILKGAMLFLVWRGSLHRITRYVDLLGFGEASLEGLKEVFVEICSMDVEDDGITFLPKSIKAEEIRPRDEYVGVRLFIGANIEGAEIRLQVDVGFGDAMAVSAMEVNFPSLLGYPSPVLRAYSPETVIAEKFEAALKLGMSNSRLKDYYDIWFLAKNFSFELDPLSGAISATIARRGTVLSKELPSVFAGRFGNDREKILQWRAFWKKSIRTDPIPELSEVVAFIGCFLSLPVEVAAEGRKSLQVWQPGGFWIGQK
jgi:predicted nucleotidyltransferase component of viral defense system